MKNNLLLMTALLMLFGGINITAQEKPESQATTAATTTAENQPIATMPTAAAAEQVPVVTSPSMGTVEQMPNTAAQPEATPKTTNIETSVANAEISKTEGAEQKEITPESMVGQKNVAQQPTQQAMQTPAEENQKVVAQQPAEVKPVVQEETKKESMIKTWYDDFVSWKYWPWNWKK